MFSLGRVAVVVVSVWGHACQEVSPLVGVLSVLAMRVVVLIVIQGPVCPVLGRPIGGTLCTVSQDVFFGGPTSGLYDFQFRGRLAGSVCLFRAVSM